METRNLEMRQIHHANMGTYHCLTFDVTEEIREMFGIHVKEAFAVYKKMSEREIESDNDFLANHPKMVEVNEHPRSHCSIEVHPDAVYIPNGNEIIVVFDDEHRVRFWISEWGGMERIGNCV